MKAGILKELLDNIPDDMEISFWDTHDSTIDEEVLIIYNQFDTFDTKGRAVIGADLNVYKTWFLGGKLMPYESFTTSNDNTDRE